MGVERCCGLAGTMVFTLLAMAYDISAGNTTMQNYTSLDAFKTTPAFFLANNPSLAAAVPIAMLDEWACFGQKPRWMNAVTGHFRWGWSRRMRGLAASGVRVEPGARPGAGRAAAPSGHG